MPSLEIARKFSAPGPEYTSYPSTQQFSSEFDQQRYLNWQSLEQKHHEPLSLYVHIPFCKDICYHCDRKKIVAPKACVADEYLENLNLEVEMQSKLVGPQRPVTQMHWGGGTPTYLDDGQITELMHGIASHFSLLNKGYREYSIELDPRAVSISTLALLKGVGFNRINLGVQDFDTQVQRAVNRIQPFEQVAELVDAVRGHRFRSLSFDLIYGLPYQNLDSMRETLRRVVELRPDRIACYNYAHLPDRFPTQRSIDRLTLPDPEEKLMLAHLINSTLKDAGYVFIGMDHYVLPDDDLAIAQADGRLQRNLQGYSLQIAEDLLGLGLSSISQIGDFYLQNAPELSAYYSKLKNSEFPMTRGYMLNSDDKLRRQIIMSLICDLCLDVQDIENSFGIVFADYFAEALCKLRPAIESGLVSTDRERLQVTERGRPFLRELCVPFDAYLSDADRRGRSAFKTTL